ncbi:hypothetical protein BJ165DRAFT_1523755 [Panaeolus papilionaceus]|nr:hypothetical protein BJ165DRAFT_1523755 [Panaeolus papilionaceus]
MKTLSFVLLSSFLISGQASPLGNREVLRRHNGIALPRRLLLQSRMDAPAACAAITPNLPPASSSSTDPTLSSNATASRRHFSDISFSSEDEISSSFVESVTTLVSSWESLCISSGIDFSFHDSCLDLGGFDTVGALLENADPCDQQDIADRMITFAKSDGIRNKGDLINFALGYRRHARHAVRIFDILPSSLFCSRAPINAELVGVYNAQLEGCNPGIFGSSASALVPFGSDGTCPYGMSADVSTCGCSGGDDSSVSSSDDSTTSGDSSDPSDSTDDSSDSTDDPSDTTDSTSSSDSSDASTTSTASSDASTETSSTDTSSAAASSDSSAATATDPAAADVTPTNTNGPNFQPTDISGNVNDPEGR